MTDAPAYNLATAGLWFAFDEWLIDTDPGAFENWPAIQFVDAQIGGLFCHHEPLFGIQFAIPTDDPLFQLGDSYSGTNIPGASNPECTKKPEDIEHLSSQLAKLGLLIDCRRTEHFAEAYLPINAFSAWQYVILRDFKVVVPRGQQGREIRGRNELALDTLEYLNGYIQEAWCNISKQDYSIELVAAAVFENSD